MEKNACVKSSSRFMVEGKKSVYKLFDAFLQKTILEDRAIDFSKPAEVREDGSVDFAGSERCFSEIVGVKADPEYKQAMEDLLSGDVADLSEDMLADLNLAAAHVHWLWSLGMDERKTCCGKFGKSIGLQENWMDNLEGYKVNDGLWKVKLAGLKKELLLVFSILHRFVTWAKKPEFSTIEEVKAALVEFVFKSKKNCDAPVRNGLLHFCNPDKYIGIYSFEKKAELVEHYSEFLRDYRVSDYASFQLQDSIYYSKRMGTALRRHIYQANRTEEKICYIFDKMHGRLAV